MLYFLPLHETRIKQNPKINATFIVRMWNGIQKYLFCSTFLFNDKLDDQVCEACAGKIVQSRLFLQQKLLFNKNCDQVWKNCPLMFVNPICFIAKKSWIISFLFDFAIWSTFNPLTERRRHFIWRHFQFLSSSGSSLTSKSKFRDDPEIRV